MAIGGGCLSYGAPDSPVHTGHVRCASHVTNVVGFRPLELLTSGPAWMSGAHRTCIVQYPVRQYGRAWLLRASGTHWMRMQWPLARSSRCSAGSPDSPVYTGHVRWIIAEQPLRFFEVGEFRRPLFLGAPDTVRCTPDSPVNYSGAPLEIPEGGKLAPDQRCLRLSLCSFVESNIWSFY
jgi:hypothetical protein